MFLLDLIDFALAPLLRLITRPSSSARFFALMMVLAYAVVPVAVGLTDDRFGYQLVTITCMSAMSLLIGYQIRLKPYHPLRVNLNTFLVFVWGAFVIFCLLAWGLAERVPLFVALQGGSSDEIAFYRERFLKAREGWQSSFVYVSAILTGAVLPYTIATMFARRVRLRWLCFGFFLFYCVSFMEKAYMFRAALPLLYLIAQGHVRLPKGLRLSYFVGAIAAIVFLESVLSVGERSHSGMDAEFFSAQHTVDGGGSHLLWRSVAVPIFTAIDSLRVFYVDYGERYLLGATSRPFAFLFGLDYVYFERAVFSAQWGQNETATGSSNATFIVEAFVNWGYTGVAVVSLLAGVCLRLLTSVEDEPTRALWPNFCLGLFTAGFLGLMLSNGYLLMILFTVFVQLYSPETVPAAAPAPVRLRGFRPRLSSSQPGRS